MPPGPTVVLDCRWLGIGGPGRTTELVLRGLAADPPPGRWVLWGPEAATRALAWAGAEVEPIGADPRLLLGQRHAFALPPGDFYVFMHHQRPLRRVPSVTVVYDTIALRHGSSPAVRAAKRRFLKTVTRTSERVLTISEHSKAGIVRDLGVAPERVRVLRFPFDDAFAERVHALRASRPRVDAALFIGGFLPHKNLPRLLAAFARTEFCRDGGRLVLVGGTAGQAAGLASSLDERQRAFVTVRHSCSQAEVDELFATSLFLVQPSLEEGFGLPAWEAMCCGLPVCVSDGGALPEVTRGFADPFPARSVSAMAAAIDACARSARGFDPDRALAQSGVVRAGAPTIREFGAQFRAVVGFPLPPPPPPPAADAAGTAVVVVNYRTKELTAEAVASVLGEPEVREVVVVDNASADGSAEWLRSWLADDRVRVVESGANRGFGPAVNLAATLSSAPLLLVLNSDATLTPGSLGRLAGVLLADDDVGVVAPAVYRAGGTPQADAYGRLPSRRDLVLGRALADDDGDPARPGWVSGVAMLLRRADFLGLGGFDEGFEMYFEDLDLCRRLRHAGKSVRREPSASVVHQGGGSWQSGREQRRRFHRSKLRYSEKLGASRPELLVTRLAGAVRTAATRR